MSTLGLSQFSSSNEMILEQQSVRCCPRIKKEYLVKNLAMENIFSLIFSEKGEKVGSITRHWTGFVRERLLHLHAYSISFPYEADIETKSILLAAALLIDLLLSK
ncbi:phospholipid scramblase 1-like isoform X2 [Hermetia illucens]|uniref:phospholipid scramblase 1-like isoform X2 n=1 Tax=Hermetia illucens TaxID=343691 RepID=UPI0018CBF414|nr:phospholipid scramblase 1-like isoform X2 [Hermetia illucens]